MNLLPPALEQTALEHSQRIALVDTDGTELRYHELHQRVARCSQALRAAGVTKGDRIGIHLEKSAECVAWIIAVLYCGAAYVPIDPTGPDRRTQYILEDAGIRLVVSHSASLLDDKQPKNGKPKAVVLSPDPCSAQSNQGAGLVPVVSNDLAYVLYTSGSTGHPKGVALSHENAASFVSWARSNVSATPEDRFSSLAPFHFDLSIFDLFVSLTSGASLVLVPNQVGKDPRALVEFVESQAINVWYSTPSTLALWPKFGRMERHDLSCLRTVLFAGEVFPVPQLRELIERLPEARFVNFFGPTETNVCCWHDVERESEESWGSGVPIGRMCPHLRGRVVGDDECDTEAGAEGELWISGSGVMLGYRNRPLDEGFHVDGNGERWYKTGDFVREDDRGDLRFVGRRDRMVKRRGYRIELDEVEGALRECAEVQDVAVVARAAKDGPTIIAFVVRQLVDGPSTIQIRESLAPILASYMLPDEMKLVSKLPRTSTEKVDYQALLKEC